MRNFELLLQRKLKNASRVAVLGIGSELRGDDAVGMMIAKSLSLLRKTEGKTDFCSILGSTAPENFTGVIKKFRPTHLLIIDAFDMGMEAGCARFFEANDARDGISFSSHRMPIKILADYICQSFPCCVIILGIQPKMLDFGSAPSKEVRTAARKITKTLKKVLAG